MINRIAIPLEILDPKETTVAYAQLQKALKSSKDTVMFLRYFNYFLIGLISLAGLTLLVQLVFIFRGPGAAMAAHKADRAGTFKILTPQMLMVDHGARLRQQIKKRNIFAPSESSDAARLAAVTKARAEIQQRFIVAGVFIDQTPKAIIEIVTTGETVFVGEGEQIEGATVQRIADNGVTLKYKDLEFELKR